MAGVSAAVAVAAIAGVADERHSHVLFLPLLLLLPLLPLLLLLVRFYCCFTFLASFLVIVIVICLFVVCLFAFRLRFALQFVVCVCVYVAAFHIVSFYFIAAPPPRRLPFVLIHRPCHLVPILIRPISWPGYLQLFLAFY